MKKTESTILETHFQHCDWRDNPNLRKVKNDRDRNYWGLGAKAKLE